MNKFLKYFILSFTLIYVFNFFQYKILFAQNRKDLDKIRIEENAKKEKEKIKNTKVKSIEYFINGSKSGFTVFDINGNMIEDIRFSKGKEFHSELYYYNENNNLVKKTEIEQNKLVNLEIYTYNQINNKLTSEKYNGDTILQYKEFYSYDEKNNLIGENIIYNDSEYIKNIYKYDENNNRTEERQIMNVIMIPHRDPNVLNKFTYDEHGNVIEEKLYDVAAETEIENHYSYEYDKMGNILVLSAKSKDTIDCYTERMVYDSNNIKIEYASYNNQDELEYKINYRYDNKKNVIEIRHYNHDYSLNETEVFAYDESGNLIKNRLIDKNLWVKRDLIQKFDDRGNLIEVQYEAKGEEKLVITYSYVYYN